MKIVNVSKGKDNYSQKNNEIRPLESCNTTSMIMAISYIPELYKKLKESRVFIKYNKVLSQEEDCLQRFILDFAGEPTLHADLCQFTNHMLGGNHVYFSTNVDLKDIMNDLVRGLPVVISGTFPGYPNKRKSPLGHIVTLVGMKWTNDKDFEKGKLPDYFIIDDPYGNTMNDWKGSGNDIEIPYKLFNKWIKNSDSEKKWAHRFKI